MAAPTNTASMDLCGLDEVKKQLGIEDSADHPELPQMIDTASALIEIWCRRKFKYQTYTNELHDGPGSPILYVDNPKVDSVTSVETRSAAGSWQTETITYLRADDPRGVGLLYWEDGTFPLGLMNVRITYVGGLATTYSTLPRPLVQAAVEMTEVLYKRKTDGMHLMPSLAQVDGITQVFRDDAVPRSVREVIRLYRVRQWD